MINVLHGAMSKPKKGGIVSGVVSITGVKLKFNKPPKRIISMKKSVPQMSSHPVVVEVQVQRQPKQPSPYLPLTHDQLKAAVLEAYNRHLKRSAGNKLSALEMTFHNLKHMGYNEADWEGMVKIMVVMKEGIDGAKEK